MGCSANGIRRRRRRRREEEEEEEEEGEGEGEGVLCLLTRSGLTYPQVSPKVYHDSFCQLDSSVTLPWVFGVVMRNTIAYPTQQSSSPSRGIPCSHKRRNDDRVTAV